MSILHALENFSNGAEGQDYLRLADDPCSVSNYISKLVSLINPRQPDSTAIARHSCMAYFGPVLSKVGSYAGKYDNEPTLRT